MASVARDERKAGTKKPTRAVQRRRTAGGIHSRAGSSFRIRPDLAAKLEREAKMTGRSKVAIVDEALEARYAS